MSNKTCALYDVPALASYLEVSPNSVWGWMRGKTKPKNPRTCREYERALTLKKFKAKQATK